MLKFTRNNIYYTISDASKGHIWVSTSAGRIGFTNAQKRTDIACATIVFKIIETIRTKRTKSITLILDGGLRWMRKIIKLFKKEKIFIKSVLIKDRTSHNGCRAKKRRRV